MVYPCLLIGLNETFMIADKMLLIQLSRIPTEDTDISYSEKGRACYHQISPWIGLSLRLYMV